MAATDPVIERVGCNAPPRIKSPEIRIAHSWQRSVEVHHLDPWRRESPNVLQADALREHRQRIEPLLDVARSGMQTLFRQVRDAGYVLLLTDPQGVAVDFIGNPALDRDLHRAGLHLGGCWAEEYEGTCAVGLCLIDRRPITVHHGEHFRARDAALTCSAAPILAPDGSLLAVLDASALHSPDDRRSQHLVLQMVRGTARLIEHAYFLRRFERHWVLRIGNHREFLEVAADGLVALDGAGRIEAASQPFLHDAGGEAHALLGRRVEEVFGLSFGELLARAARDGSVPIELRLPQSGGRCFALLRHPHVARISGDIAGAPAGMAIASGDGPPADAPPPALARVVGTDARLVTGAHQALRVIGKGIPMLLQGESGTGKEVFARAIHAASPHARGPFVALNCAAIPESLIESELFGYRDGAFTGARAKGARGLVAQADGGTLFLDEIGDMPLAMQTRLLRVLSEREIVPLGGGRAVPVDLQVICATHRRLDTLVDSGQFRLDLYYRLNGLALMLPPLRERHDKAALIDAVLAQEARSLQRPLPRLAESARTVLLSYGWPGNLRQLKNALRAALALCDGDCIGLEHLPAEIAAAVGGAMPPARLSSLQLREGIDAPRSASDAEREALLRVLRQHRWNISQAARSLNTCRSTLYRRMQRHVIVAPNQREGEPDC